MAALSFYKSKMDLNRPNGVISKLSWLDPNHFDQVQIRLLWTNFYDLDLSKMIWTWPKLFGRAKIILAP